jgi:CheY-like chemotaxis protein
VSGHESNAAPPESGQQSIEHYACALHEVSNALTVVLGWLEMAQQTDSMEEVREAVSVALEHARRGRVMARRSIGAEADSAHEARSASALVSFALTSVGPQAKARSVQLSRDLGEGTDVRVEADSQVLQILTNLLLNAISFSAEGGEVNLSVKRDDAGVSFRVRDHGPGVRSDVASGLFTQKNSTRPGGAGIGLPVSRQIARENGGELRLLPDLDGRGACFELHWPAAPFGAVPSIYPDGLRLALEGKRVLVIEDDISICSLVELSLEAHGAQVLTITDTAQVDEVLRNRPLFDVVLLDLSPVRHRLMEILARLSHLSPTAPVILMSGEPTGVPSEAQGRFAAWVRKPFDISQLMETMARLILDAHPPE